MRIISGKLKGKKLKSPEGKNLRPTSDKVKEALFNILNLDYHGLSVIDIFAGSGSLGIEALSRGAGECVFVENSSKSFKILEENINNCGLKEKSRLIKYDAYKYIKALSEKGEKFDLVFADPPYEAGHLKKLLKNQWLPGVIMAGGLFIIEHSVNEPVYDAYKMDWEILTQKRYGKITLTFFISRKR